MSNQTPVKLAILWHMHQPDYRRPMTNYMVMPWVRLHALKDYLDMPLRAARFDKLKITFNLVPSLLDQLQAYVDGALDPHLELTAIPAEQLNENQKLELLNTFFSAPVKTMIEPHKRYYQLYRKAKENIKSVAVCIRHVHRYAETGNTDGWVGKRFLLQSEHHCA